MARKSETLKHAVAGDAAEQAKPVAATVVAKTVAAPKQNDAKLLKAKQKELTAIEKAKLAELKALRKAVDDASDEMSAEEIVLRKQIGGLQKQLDKLIEKNQKALDKLEKAADKQVLAATKRFDKGIAVLQAEISKLQG